MLPLLLVWCFLLSSGPHLGSLPQLDLTFTLQGSPAQTSFDVSFNLHIWILTMHTKTSARRHHPSPSSQKKQASTRKTAGHSNLPPPFVPEPKAVQRLEKNWDLWPPLWEARSESQTLQERVFVCFFFCFRCWTASSLWPRAWEARKDRRFAHVYGWTALGSVLDWECRRSLPSLGGEESMGASLWWWSLLRCEQSMAALTYLCTALKGSSSLALIRSL